MSNNSELNIFVSTFLEEARDNLELWEKTCLDLEKNPSQELFATLFRLAHNLKGSARSVGLETFGSFIHKVEDIISLLRDGQREFNIEFISLFFKCHTILDNWCEELHKDLNYTPKDLCEFEDYIRQFNPSMSENKTEDQSFGVFTEEAQPDKVEIKKIAEPITKINSSNKIDTIRIPINKIETIMNHISELCSNHSIIFHCKNNNKYNSNSFNNAVNICKKIIKELQSNVFSLRMVLLTSIFQRLERTAVSLAIQQNKKIEIIMDGSHIEIDKIIIEKIMDPLVHVIRNAVDHAIEHEEERIKKSKPLISSIKISAMQNTSHVIITITDDGRGINAKNVFQKAVQKNMVAENAKLSEQEIYQFLFSPGFSTAEKITEVSGRGVGLDVVKQLLHEIGGHVNIQSQVDIGSKFEFHLPSNLSIIETLIRSPLKMFHTSFSLLRKSDGFDNFIG